MVGFVHGSSSSEVLEVLTSMPCTIEIAWVDLGRPYPGSYKQEILANRGQKVRSRSTGGDPIVHGQCVHLGVMVYALDPIFIV